MERFMFQIPTTTVSRYLKKLLSLINPRAIIVAGRASAGDSLWDATQVCTNFAYRALTYQGYTKR